MQLGIDIMGTSRGTIDEGKVAALLGYHLSENPYPEGSDDHREWAEGHTSLTGSRECWTLRETATAKVSNSSQGIVDRES